MAFDGEVHFVENWERVNDKIHFVKLGGCQVLRMPQHPEPGDVCRAIRLILEH